MLKDQEKRYVVQNSNLYRYVIEREKEIENLIKLIIFFNNY